VGETFAIGDLDKKPKAIVRETPVYPPEMMAAKIEGKALVAFVIDSTGGISGAHVVESSRPEFEAAAVAAVRKWQFEPGRKGDRAVNVRVSQEVIFNLGSGPAPSNWF
jgi:protein TonB